MSDFDTIWENGLFEHDCTDIVVTDCAHIKTNEYVKNEIRKACLHYLSTVTLVRIVVTVIKDFAFVDILYNTG